MSRTIAYRTALGALVLTVLGCSAGDSTSTTSTGGSATAYLKISGSVSSTNLVSTSSFSVFSQAMKKVLRLVNFSTDPCASSPWELYYVGGGGSKIASGTADAVGDFSVPSVPKGKEGIVKFTGASCSQRCLVKAGDAGIYCNPVADAVVGAFEQALSKSITHSDYADTQLAKIGSAIQQASEGDSAAITAFNEDIAACVSVAEASRPACYKSAIEASPFGGQFKMLKAAASGWTVEALYTFLTDTAGFSVSIDPFIYRPFGSKMDDWLGTDFVANSKTFISALMTDQAAGGTSTYAVKISCRGSYSKYHAGGQFNFDPVLSSGTPSCANQAALEANGLSTAQATTVMTAISNGTHEAIQLGSVACNTPNGWDNPNYFCMWPPEMLITSKFKEVNRNDPEGKNGSFEESRSISMVNIFPEMNTVLAGLGSMNPPEGDCATFTGDGPPTIKNSTACQNWFGTIMQQNKKNFAGILGLYMYLKNPSAYATGGSTKLSLNDIHKIFTGSSYLNAKVVAWAPMYNGVGVNFNVPGGGTTQRWLQPILAYNSSTDRYSLQDVFKYTSGGSGSITETQANTALAASTLPYKYTFKMFEEVPDADKIRNFIFGSAHHEEWNPSGTKFYYAAGVMNTGNPILCKMINPDTNKATESELSTKTKIECLTDYTGISTTDGTLTGASSTYPYVLVGRGWNGDAEGNLYALADRKTGIPVRPGNSEILVKEFRASNATVCKTNGEKNTVITSRMKMGWGNDSREEAVKTFCMDMSSYTNSGMYRFYDGGEVEIKQKTSDGQVNTYKMRQVGVRSTTGDDQTTLQPLCAYSSHVSTDSTTNLSTLTGGTLTSGSITDLGTSDMVFDLCSSTSHSSLTKYYLLMMGKSEDLTRNNIRAYLMTATDPQAFVQSVAWGISSKFEDTLMGVGPNIIEVAMTAKLVAPSSTPVFTSNVQLLNTKYNAKFDPYCDDTDGDGYCDCYEAATYNANTGTGPLKTNPQQCNLLDFAAEPTMSNAPYCVQCDNSAKIAALFAAMGGKSGSDLTTVPSLTVGGSTISGGTFDGNYLNGNSMWFNIDEAFRCQYKQTGESFYRKPKFIRMEGFSKNHQGCPNSGGTIVDITNWGQMNEAGGGPIRMVKPSPMNNAYDVAKPDTLMKLINYATKSVGQSVSLASTDKVFSFDEALAMVSMRNQLPINVQVYNSDQTSRAPGAHPMIQEVETATNHNDAASAVLRGLTKPAELQ